MTNDTSGPEARNQLADKVLQGFLRHQRSGRRWSIFFRLLFFAWLFFVTWKIVSPGSDAVSSGTRGPVTAVVRMDGVIGSDPEATSRSVMAGLEQAFGQKNVRGIVLSIDSPGGSSVQSGQIYDGIMRLRKAHPDKKIYAVIGDSGTSGAYYVAAATDKIYADRASFVGSIGAYVSAPDLTGLGEKLGISMRVYRSGKYKAMPDPFLPVDPAFVKSMEQSVREVHRQFIARVEAGRGNRLKKSPDLFTGLVWTGQHALRLGLIDGLGGTDYVAREVVGAPKTVDFTTRADIFERLSRYAGMSLARAAQTLVPSLSGPQFRY